MVKATVEKGGKIEMTINGSALEIAVDVLVIVNAVYNSIRESDADDAEKFKMIVCSKAIDNRFWDMRSEGAMVSVKIPRKYEPEVE